MANRPCSSRAPVRCDLTFDSVSLSSDSLSLSSETMAELPEATPGASRSTAAFSSLPDVDEWDDYLKGSTADSSGDIPDFESLLRPPSEPATSEDLAGSVLAPGFGSRPIKLVLPKEIARGLAALNKPELLFDQRVLPFLHSLREDETFAKEIDLEALPRLNREARISFWLIAQSGLAPTITVAYHRTLLDLSGVAGLKSSSIGARAYLDLDVPPENLNLEACMEQATKDIKSVRSIVSASKTLSPTSKAAVTALKDLQGRSLILEQRSLDSTWLDLLHGSVTLPNSSNLRGLSHLLLQGILLGCLTLPSYGRPCPGHEISTTRILPPW